MNIIIAVVFLFAISIVVFSFIDLKISVAIYLSYSILVPYLEFRIAGLPLSYNLVNLLLFAVFLYHGLIKKSVRLNFQAVLPFLFLYLSLLFLSLFTSEMPWGLQFNGWRASFMQTCLISFIVWNLALTDSKFLDYFKWAFIISISIAGIYGVTLMSMEGLNPYTSTLSDYFGKDDMALRFSTMEGRLDFSSASKIQSTMAHPMTWTLIVSFSIIILWAINFNKNNKLIWLLLGLLIFNVFISGVRTGIAALAIGFFYFLVMSRNFKLIVFTFLAFAAVTLVIQSNDSLSNLFTSFTDVSGKKSDVSGSSISMRIDQLQGTIDEIQGHEFAGKGYGWTGYYMSLNGTHPVILAFESLIFMILCNSGYLGLMVWILFFIMLLLANRKILVLKADILFMDTFIVVYASFATGTGEYSYMPFFALFYSFMLGYLKSNQQNEQEINQNLVRNNRNYIKFETLK